MKTPMQELIEQLKEQAQFIKDDDCAQDKFYRTGLRNAIKYAESMRGREKAAICEFTYKCRNVMATDYLAISHWYDETFNTKEK